MTVKRLGLAALGAAIAVTSMVALKAEAADQYIPLLVYRTGPYAPNGIPSANGFVDYFKMLNARDKGVNGVNIAWEECEMQYDTKLGVECYERLKKKTDTGASLINPYSTGITYALIPKAPVDKVPLHSMGYGNTAAADGRVFPWTFNFPTTYWSQASAKVKYIGAREGGMDKLKGKKLVLVYHNSPYGKEPIPTLEVLAQKYGYQLTLLPVDHPGQEQKAAWLQIRRIKPDWIFLWGWGVMNQVAVKEAASINFPMDRFIGVWWSGTETDVVPAGDGAKGYLSATFHAPGDAFPVHKEILKHVYNNDAAAAKKNNYGEVLYNRGIINAVYNIEAIRAAMKKYGNKPMNGEQVRWGFENLTIDVNRLKELGLEGFTKPVKVTCEDHEGNGPVIIQQWDGKAWKFVSDWIEPMRDVIRPMIEEAAAKFAKENNITPRDCSKEG
ncbi:MAG: ABC transporter substrate-binding protein [Alphaproteobacteria bacterium]|nr:ABC transporter substrate-binding protein [Alphaproteobacteria bacterium]